MMTGHDHRHSHDLHIWPLSTTETALTAHLVMPQQRATSSFLAEVAEALRHEFEIAHATLQVDVAVAGEDCERC